MTRPLALHDPYATDRTPRVTIEVEHKGIAGISVPQVQQIVDVEEYSYDSDVLTIFDSFALTVGNPDGVHTGDIAVGDTVRLKMADPEVAGGAEKLRLLGVVTGVRSVAKGGHKLLVQGADLGWHLANNDAPLWMSLSGGATLGHLLDLAIETQEKVGTSVVFKETGWGFQGFDDSNLSNRRLNQGRAGIERSLIKRASEGGKFTQFIPPIQVETGTKIADLLIQYCRRERKLVNVSSDGVLQVWAPDYRQEPSYTIEYHADERRTRNNVIDVTVDDRIDGLYTDVSCVTSRIYSQKYPNPEDPNADKLKGRFLNSGTLPFLRRATFTDGDQIGRQMANTRAKWYWQRGIFDSWTYSAVLQGHSQHGIFFAPDTIVTINDSINKVFGNYYVSAVNCARRFGQDNGTLATLTIHKVGFLAA